MGHSVLLLFCPTPPLPPPSSSSSAPSLLLFLFCPSPYTTQPASTAEICPTPFALSPSKLIALLLSNPKTYSLIHPELAHQTYTPSPPLFSLLPPPPPNPKIYSPNHPPPQWAHQTSYGCPRRKPTWKPAGERRDGGLAWREEA